ncbi:MAG: site-2 protease family protein [Candidatus Diapherotrites archaeon]|nr:site-2 protease family protein [Candidatus Diapherotrites archaeon]
MQNSELIQILISWVTLSLAFSMASVYTHGLLPALTTSFPIILLTLGTGFIFHELGHRWVAKKFGCIAFFKMWWQGLALALGMAIMTGGRLIFAAPGAVMIGGKRLTLRESGLIAVTGPVINLAVGVVFLALSYSSNTLVSVVGDWGAYINFFLAAFNLIPFPPLDGNKVLQWNPLVWFLAIAAAGYLLLPYLT